MAKSSLSASRIKCERHVANEAAQKKADAERFAAAILKYARELIDAGGPFG